MPGKSSAAEMPRLDVFDQEFEHERAAIARGPRRKSRLKLSAWIFLLIGAGVISALVLGWPNGDGPLRFELQSAPISQRTATRDDSEEIDRLRHEVDTLKKEINELHEAQRQAGETIATLQAAAEQESQPVAPGGYWYSSLAALNFGITNQSPPRVTAPPPPRRPATARPAPREPPRNGNGGNGGGAPLSLEAPQQ